MSTTINTRVQFEDAIKDVVFISGVYNALKASSVEVLKEQMSDPSCTSGLDANLISLIAEDVWNHQVNG